MGRSVGWVSLALVSCVASGGRNTATAEAPQQAAKAPLDPSEMPPPPVHDEAIAAASNTEARDTAVAAPVFERPAEWPAALVFPEGFDPENTNVLVGERDEIQISHWLANSTVADAVAAWSAALSASGLEARTPCTPSPNYACVWSKGDRVVAMSVVGGPDPGDVSATVHWLPTGHVPATRLPGPCVTPPEQRRALVVTSAGIDQQGEFRQARTGFELTTHESLDVDGDGTADRFVPHAKIGACPWEVPHDVYVMRGKCGHRVGTIIGNLDAETTIAPFRKGLREIHTSASWATHGAKSPIPEHHTRTRHYRFDGRRFRELSDKTSTGTCHHCGVASCSEE